MSKLKVVLEMKTQVQLRKLYIYDNLSKLPMVTINQEFIMELSFLTALIRTMHILPDQKNFVSSTHAFSFSILSMFIPNSRLCIVSSKC